MKDSYPFPIYSGLLEPKHYKNIGSALWLFLWCVKSITKDVERDGIMWGLVHRSTPLKLPDLADQFGVDERTIRRWLGALEQHDYIRVDRAPYGVILRVKNSKKYAYKRPGKDDQIEDESPDNNVQSDEERTDKNVRTERGEWTDMSNHSDKNVRSNKDIIKTLIDRLIDGLDDEILKTRCGVLTSAAGSFSAGQIHLDQESILKREVQIENHFNNRKARLTPNGKDWTHVNAVAKSDIPMEFILFGIDLAFARHAQSRMRETEQIRSFAYCKTVILDTWGQFNQWLEEIESGSDGGAPATGQAVVQKSAKQRNQNEESLRKLREAQERERERDHPDLHEHPERV